MRVNVEGDTAIIRLSGNIDARSAQGLEEKVLRFVNDNIVGIDIDLSGVPLMTSAGLRALVSISRSDRLRSGLTLRHASPLIRSLMEVAGVGHLPSFHLVT
ncbi:MAG: STAS domain-containing protein [Geminicoccaceae bacterium]